MRCFVVLTISVCAGLTVPQQKPRGGLQRSQRKGVDSSSSTSSRCSRRRRSSNFLLAVQDAAAATDVEASLTVPLVGLVEGKTWRKKASKIPSRDTVDINRKITRKEGSAQEILELFSARGGEFSEVNLATAMNWLAKRQPKNGYTSSTEEGRRVCALVSSAAEQCATDVEQWDARALANAAWGAAKLRTRGHDELGQAAHRMLRAIAAQARQEDRAEDFKPQELANVAWSMATAALDDPVLFEKFAVSATKRIASFSPQEMANTAWAFAKRIGMEMGACNEAAEGDIDALERLAPEWGRAAVEGGRLLAAVAVVAPAGLDRGDFKPQEVANTAWAMATAGFNSAPTEFWDAAARAASASADDDSTRSQNLANVAWAFSKAGRYGDRATDSTEELFRTLARASEAKMGTFNAQELGNTAWAFATSSYPAPELFEKIAGASVSQVSRFTTQNLANMAWAFATVGIHAPRLFDAIAGQVALRADDFKPQELSNTAWAFATACSSETSAQGTTKMMNARSTQMVFASIARSSSTRLHEFTHQGITNVAWAFAKVHDPARTAAFPTASEAMVEHSVFYAAISTEACKPHRMAEFQPQGLSNLVWAYSTVDLRAPELFEAISREITSSPMRAASLNPQELANVAWAFAKSGLGKPELYETLGFVILSLSRRTKSDDLSLAGFTPQELANTAWSYACANHVDPPLLRQLWKAVDSLVRKQQREPFTLEERRQLQQVVLHAQHESLGGYASLISDIARAPAQFTAQLRVSLQDVEAQPSRAQLEVATALEVLGIEVQHELILPDGLSLDVALLPLSNRIAVEFDGPRHYFRNDLRHPLGRTSFKRRLLVSLGWRVIHVPYWDWTTLRTPDAKRKYMRTKLLNLLSSTPSKKKQTKTVLLENITKDDADDAVTTGAIALGKRAVEALTSQKRPVDNNRASLADMSVTELKVVIRERNDGRTANTKPPKMKLAGKREELVKRIQDDDQEAL